MSIDNYRISHSMKKWIIENYYLNYNTPKYTRKRISMIEIGLLSIFISLLLASFTVYILMVRNNDKLKSISRYGYIDVWFIRQHYPVETRQLLESVFYRETADTIDRIMNYTHSMKYDRKRWSNIIVATDGKDGFGAVTQYHYIGKDDLALLSNDFKHELLVEEALAIALHSFEKDISIYCKVSTMMYTLTLKVGYENTICTFKDWNSVIKIGEIRRFKNNIVYMNFNTASYLGVDSDGDIINVVANDKKIPLLAMVTDDV